MGVVSNLGAKINLEATGFQKGAALAVSSTEELEAAIVRMRETSNRALPKVGENMENVSKKMGRSSQKTTFAVQQLAFGLEDFASVFALTGFQGGLRAAGNNISQFASIMNPVAGITASVALGLTALVPAFANAGGAAETAAQKTKRYADELERLQKVRERNRELERVDGVNQAKGAVQEIQDALADNQARIRNVQLGKTGNVAVLREQLAEAKKAERTARQLSSGQAGGSGAVIAAAEKRRKIEKAIADEEKVAQREITTILQEQKTLRGELLTAQKRLVEETRKERQEEKAKAADKAKEAAAKQAEKDAKDRAAAQKRAEAESARRLETARRSFDQIQDEIDPRGAAARQVERNLKNRLAEIDATDLSAEQKAGLSGFAQEAARKERRRLDLTERGKTLRDRLDKAKDRAGTLAPGVGGADISTASGISGVLAAVRQSRHINDPAQKQIALLEKQIEQNDRNLQRIGRSLDKNSRPIFVQFNG